MGRLRTVEAIVLKTYSIGDADRLCVLLTAEDGRLVVVAKGVRKPGSKNCGVAQAFQCIEADISEHSSGLYLGSARVKNVYEAIRSDMTKFSVASHACELLLQLLHDTDPAPEIYPLVQKFLGLCSDDMHPHLFLLFRCHLLRCMGLFPGGEIPKMAVYDLAGDVVERLQCMSEEVLKGHLDYPLKSTTVKL